jgi:hypothetical protein
MKQIYAARNDMEAHFVQGLLEQEEIKSVIEGEALEGAWGDLRVSDTSLPTIWVNEDDMARAQPIVEEYIRREQKLSHETQAEVDVPRATWKCPKCGEEVEEQFDKCWNCETSKPGSENQTPSLEEPKSETAS